MYISHIYIYIIFRSYIKSHTHIYIYHIKTSHISHIKYHILKIIYHKSCITYHIISLIHTYIYIYTYYIISYIIYHHIFHVISQSFAVEVRTSFTSFRAPRPLWPWPPATVNQLGVVLSPPIRDGLTDWHWKNDTWNILKYEYPLVN